MDELVRNAREFEEMNDGWWMQKQTPALRTLLWQVRHFRRRLLPFEHIDWEVYALSVRYRNWEERVHRYYMPPTPPDTPPPAPGGAPPRLPRFPENRQNQRNRRGRGGRGFQGGIPRIGRRRAHNGQEDCDMAHQTQITDNWKPEYSSGNQVLANNGAMPSSEIVEDTEIIEKLVRKKKFDPTDKYVITDPSATYVNSEDHVIVINKHTDPIAYELTRADERYVTNLNSRRRVISRRPYINTHLFTQIMQALKIDSFRRIHNYLLDNLHAVYLKAATFEEDENAECDICRLIDSEEDDMMVFCEMCNTCVHISCSGLQEIPPDEWMCPKWFYTRTPAPPCCLCPVLGGSMTYNEDKSQWAHHACALFMPEIIFINEEERAPFSAYENVSAERFTQVCRVCDTSIGACVTCSWQDCEETHHVGCALRAGLTVSVMEVGDADGNVERRTYCHRHTPEFVFDRRFIDYPSPWVAKMESVFFLMTNYEQIANELDIEECIVSDVYEYWKIKRIDNSDRPLITSLRDYIKLEPTIERVAARVEQGLHCKLDRLLYPKGSSDQHHHHFFRRAALMVTEHRQHSLKRVRSNIRKDQKMLTKVVKREIMKKEVIQTEMEKWEHVMKMARNGMAKDLLKVLILLSSHSAMDFDNFEAKPNRLLQMISNEVQNLQNSTRKSPEMKKTDVRVVERPGKPSEHQENQENRGFQMIYKMQNKNKQQELEKPEKVQKPRQNIQKESKEPRKIQKPPKQKNRDDRETPAPSRCLGVFNLSSYTTDKDLRDVFGDFGEIEKCELVYDRPSGHSRGFGFIYYREIDDATAARDKLCNTDLDGHKIRVDYSFTKRGQYMGERRGGGSGFGGGDRHSDRGGGRGDRYGGGGRRSPDRRSSHHDRNGAGSDRRDFRDRRDNNGSSSSGGRPYDPSFRRRVESYASGGSGGGGHRRRSSERH